ncbi:MAG: general secretion pathway protein GspB [Desulfobacterales bacterium]|nr:general secretion pathway protein GspB [Desulfobacterales bacterium]MBF0395904.1 general secretion pathway protein GspB [Desulfobacterales bacterium]
MSSILKALKQLETASPNQDRNAKNLFMLGASKKVIRNRVKEAWQNRRFVLFTFSILALIIFISFTFYFSKYFFVQSEKNKPKVKIKPTIELKKKEEEKVITTTTILEEEYEEITTTITPKKEPLLLQKKMNLEINLPPLNSPDIKIQAIAWSANPKSSIAVINDRIVKRGDLIDGAKLIEIKEKSIVMELQGSKWEIEFKPKQ